MESVLGYLDDSAKKSVFHDNLSKLEAAPSLDFDALRLCIHLLPPINPEDIAKGLEFPHTLFPHGKLFDLLQLHISQKQDQERLYQLAELCLSNSAFAAYQLDERIYDALRTLLKELLVNPEKVLSDDQDILLLEERTSRVAAYLNFLKASFWLPNEHYHLIRPNSIALISDFFNIHNLDDVAHDALGALLALLKSSGSIVVPQHESSSSHFKYEPTLRRTVLNQSIIDQAFWSRISQFDAEYFLSTSNKVYRTWFQWISQARADGVDLECLYDDQWSILQIGLYHGFADQRKYCLGILRQSLLAAQRDIDSSTIQFKVNQRDAYLAAYEQYSMLFETIVLDRYLNQVQACVPELTLLLGSQSKISPALTTTLLAGALNSKVQEGVRKTIGNWYMHHMLETQISCSNHVDFFLDGFLPWATEGSLFTSSLTLTRTGTVCAHGAVLTSLVARFVSCFQETETSTSSMDEASEMDTESSRKKVILGVVRYVLNARGRIFQPAILYLLEGLVNGLQACSSVLSQATPFSKIEIDDILRLSRIPGLPEISTGLQGAYCWELCNLTAPDWNNSNASGHGLLSTRIVELQKTVDSTKSVTGNETTLQDFLEKLRSSKHRYIQNDGFAPACKNLIAILDQADTTSINHDELFSVLDAFWEEAERREFSRSVAIYLPPLLFHTTCIQVCVSKQTTHSPDEESLKSLLSKAMGRLQMLSRGRSYVLSGLAKALRKAAFAHPSVLDILPYDEFIIDFVNDPPSVQPEFRFEVAAAEKLQLIFPHRTYSSYYGQREWNAYAAVIDLIRRFPKHQGHVAKRILDSLLEPWKTQKPPILIKSKWKYTMQLQAMFLLSDFCISDSDVDIYLEAFMYALMLEPWPRYRCLLEWIVARILIRFPGKARRVLDDLENLDNIPPIQIASLMKLGLLVAPSESEEFAVKIVTHLNSFSASPKIHIRHEANFTFPMIMDIAFEKDWKLVTGNPAFVALNTFLRGLDKFKASAWSIRTLRLDVVNDFTLVKIFQGQYLTIETPEKERVSYEDFIQLEDEDKVSGTKAPPPRIALGHLPNIDVTPSSTVEDNPVPKTTGELKEAAAAFLQTKSGFDVASLHPANGPPSMQNQRPASVILVASLIDNPTNLGGLSRISESFGLEALYIDDAKKTAHKDFKATSVTSEKHLPIKELKVASVPDFLLDAKRKGYEVVGIEQTDRSGVLGEPGSEATGSEGRKDAGTLPKKCVLVLGSEKGGISPEVLAVVDRCVEIRTVGVTRSLNVQTAGGIAVYEWWREWSGKSG